MPRRLLLAAEIVRDVAHSCANSMDAETLKTAAENLEVLATDAAQHNGINLQWNHELAMLGASIRRLAAGLDPEVREPIHPDSPMGSLVTF